jgi:uncharacterized membrane protein YoaK (UPF0700 family)
MVFVLHTPDTIFSPRHTPSWLLLTCAAGAVNGIGFLACAQYVTHVTGTATRLGLEWPHVGIAMEYLAVVLSFVVGAMASVLALQGRTCRGKRAKWATPLLAVAVILVGTGVAGQIGAFGPFGVMAVTDPPFVMLSLLAFSMGLQNAAVSTTTGLAVRTTHLTGPATDLGIHLGVAWFSPARERNGAFKAAALRAGKMVAFAVGAGLALPLTAAAGYLALLVPAVFVLIAAALSFAPEWGPSDFPSEVVNATIRPPRKRAPKHDDPEDSNVQPAPWSNGHERARPGAPAGRPQ